LFELLGKRFLIVFVGGSFLESSIGMSDKKTTDIADTYNEFKEFEGHRYTGMKIGRGHKWYYSRGVWKETKLTPDEWQINYDVKKRRAGKAPEGSGVPVGTQYHWYIVAHQNVTKLNANDYSTSLTGLKFKLAHKRADKTSWSASIQTQRKNAIKILRTIIETLEQQIVEEEKKVTPLKKKATHAGAKKKGLRHA
jgi:hypothetical protein